MTHDKILEICRATPNIGIVTHEEFSAYVLALTQRRRGDDGEWQTTEHPYMTVDGKLAMANQDHTRQNKRLDFAAPRVMIDNENQLTLLVTVTSELYGTRHGIATSRRVGGTSAEREFPWEVAETSAVGRALAAMGYGLFPGAGMASADDMLRASSTPNGASNSTRPARTQRRPNPMTAVQRSKLLELCSTTQNISANDAPTKLDELLRAEFKHGAEHATYEEAQRMIAMLLKQQPNNPN